MLDAGYWMLVTGCWILVHFTARNHVLVPLLKATAAGESYGEGVLNKNTVLYEGFLLILDIFCILAMILLKTY